MYVQSQVRKIHRNAHWEIGKDQELDSARVTLCSGILNLLIIFTGHDIILCAVFHHGLYIDGPDFSASLVA